MAYSTWQLAGILAAAVAGIFILSAALFLKTQEFDSESVDWSSVNIRVDGPPEPVFNSKDNSQCRSVVEQYYEQASSTFDYNTKNDAKLSASYNGILAKQSAYGVNLANNPDFRTWVLSDWPDSWQAQNDPQAEPPAYSD